MLGRKAGSVPARAALRERCLLGSLSIRPIQGVTSLCGKGNLAYCSQQVTWPGLDTRLCPRKGQSLSEPQRLVLLL